MKILQTTNIASKIYEDALLIRKIVFIEEQGVDEALEIDELEDECEYFVLYLDDKPAATCRIYPLKPKTWKIQRVAVLKEHRNKQLGKQVIRFVEAYAKTQGIEELVLGAQVSAIGFYERLGYEAYGDEFMDADIPHYMMKKSL